MSFASSVPTSLVMTSISSGPYTVLQATDILKIDVSSGDVTVNLLNPTTAIQKPQEFLIIGTSQQNAAILTTPSGIIGLSGQSTLNLKGINSYIKLYPNGTNYDVLFYT